MKTLITNLLLILFSITIYSQDKDSNTDNEKVYLYIDNEIRQSPKPKEVEVFEKWIMDNNQLLTKKKDLKYGYSVQLVLVVDSSGKLIDSKIWRGIEPHYDKEAIRLIREQPNEWEPGLLKDGTPATVKFYYDIDFRE